MNRHELPLAIVDAGYLRLSVGLEDVSDLRRDLRTALDLADRLSLPKATAR